MSPLKSLIAFLLLTQVFLAGSNYFSCPYPNNQPQKDCQASQPNACYFPFVGLPKSMNSGCVGCSAKGYYGLKTQPCENFIRKCTSGKGFNCRIVSNNSNFCAFQEGKAPISLSLSDRNYFGLAYTHYMEGQCPYNPKLPPGSVAKMCPYHTAAFPLRSNITLKGKCENSPAVCGIPYIGLPGNSNSCISCFNLSINTYKDSTCEKIIFQCKNPGPGCGVNFTTQEFCAFENNKFPVTLQTSNPKNKILKYTSVMAGPCPINPMTIQPLNLCRQKKTRAQCGANETNQRVCVFKTVGLPEERVGCECTRDGDYSWVNAPCQAFLTRCSGRSENCGDLINSNPFCAFEEGKSPISINPEAPNPRRTYTHVIPGLCFQSFKLVQFHRSVNDQRPLLYQIPPTKETPISIPWPYSLMYDPRYLSSFRSSPVYGMYPMAQQTRSQAAAQRPMQRLSQASSQRTMQKPMQTSAQRPIQTAYQRPLQRNIQRSAQKLIQTGYQRPMQRSIQKPIQSFYPKATQTPYQRPMQKPIQRSVQKSIQRPIQRPMQRPSKKPCRDRSARQPNPDNSRCWSVLIKFNQRFYDKFNCSLYYNILCSIKVLRSQKYGIHRLVKKQRFLKYILNC